MMFADAIKVRFGVIVLQVTLRPVLRTVFLSPLSVTLVYCGQTVGWIKMPLGTDRVGLSRRDIVLDGDPAPPRKGAQQPPPNFRPMSIVAKRSPISATRPTEPLFSVMFEMVRWQAVRTSSPEKQHSAARLMSVFAPVQDLGHFPLGCRAHEDMWRNNARGAGTR